MLRHFLLLINTEFEDHRQFALGQWINDFTQPTNSFWNDASENLVVDCLARSWAHEHKSLYGASYLHGGTIGGA